MVAPQTEVFIYLRDPENMSSFIHLRNKIPSSLDPSSQTTKPWQSSSPWSGTLDSFQKKKQGKLPTSFLSGMQNNKEYPTKKNKQTTFLYIFPFKHKGKNSSQRSSNSRPSTRHQNHRCSQGTPPRPPWASPRVESPRKPRS